MKDRTCRARRSVREGLLWSAMLGIISALTPAFAVPPYKYYVLTPEPAFVLENNVLKSALSGGSPANHEVEWKGYDQVDTNNVLITADGVYTFTIQATGAMSGLSTLYRGSLQLYQ
jgi:hypothetical protein